MMEQGFEALEQLLRSAGGVSDENPVRIPENDLLWIDLQWFAAEDEGRTEDRPSTSSGRPVKRTRRQSQELNGALVL